MVRRTKSLKILVIGDIDFDKSLFDAPIPGSYNSSYLHRHGVEQRLNGIYGYNSTSITHASVFSFFISITIFLPNNI